MIQRWMGGWNEIDIQICPADKMLLIIEMMTEGTE